ncbi:MAG: hypothetical protein IPK14_13095 [Blastocatellia bacterium]|nr:hypothetical protein [Blastocatellia bacterium]MBN8725935.1 hypothetical protein [Acidobacteriota bacterium]
MSFLNFFKRIGSFFANLFGNKKVQEAAGKLAGLVKIAFPVVELVAQITPTKADDLLVEAAKNIGISINEIVSSTNDLVRDGGRQRLAAEALKLKLLELVQNGKQVKLDDFTIKTTADVLNLDKTTLLTAVQSAVFFWKTFQKSK